ncbi:hypothetical protein M405DRAFT_884863 [Rhizopogon salebrosus TDB-379]|nr:hypothetical protein M405DRAFT_884863 [Rhizopogon salebrosus TDB-379]
MQVIDDISIHREGDVDQEDDAMIDLNTVMASAPSRVTHIRDRTVHGVMEISKDIGEVEQTLLRNSACKSIRNSIEESLRAHGVDIKEAPSCVVITADNMYTGSGRRQNMNTPKIHSHSAKFKKSPRDNDTSRYTEKIANHTKDRMYAAHMPSSRQRKCLTLASNMIYGGNDTNASRRKVYLCIRVQRTRSQGASYSIEIVKRQSDAVIHCLRDEKPGSGDCGGEDMHDVYFTEG